MDEQTRTDSQYFALEYLIEQQEVDPDKYKSYQLYLKQPFGPFDIQYRYSPPPLLTGEQTTETIPGTQKPNCVMPITVDVNVLIDEDNQLYLCEALNLNRAGASGMEDKKTVFILESFLNSYERLYLVVPEELDESSVSTFQFIRNRYAHLADKIHWIADPNTFDWSTANEQNAIIIPCEYLCSLFVKINAETSIIEQRTVKRLAVVLERDGCTLPIAGQHGAFPMLNDKAVFARLMQDSVFTPTTKILHYQSDDDFSDLNEAEHVVFKLCGAACGIGICIVPVSVAPAVSRVIKTHLKKARDFSKTAAIDDQAIDALAIEHSAKNNLRAFLKWHNTTGSDDYFIVQTFIKHKEYGTSRANYRIWALLEFSDPAQPTLQYFYGYGRGEPASRRAELNCKAICLAERDSLYHDMTADDYAALEQRGLAVAFQDIYTAFSAVTLADVTEKMGAGDHELQDIFWSYNFASYYPPLGENRTVVNAPAPYHYLCQFLQACYQLDALDTSSDRMDLTRLKHEIGVLRQLDTEFPQHLTRFQLLKLQTYLTRFNEKRTMLGITDCQQVAAKITSYLTIHHLGYSADHEFDTTVFDKPDTAVRHYRYRDLVLKAKKLFKYGYKQKAFMLANTIITHCEAKENTLLASVLMIAYYITGNYYKFTGDSDRANQAYGKAIDLLPHEFSTNTQDLPALPVEVATKLWRFIGQCYAAIGQTDEARAYYQTALSVLPMNARNEKIKTYSTPQMIFFTKQQKKLTDAIANAEHDASGVNPGMP